MALLPWAALAQSDVNTFDSEKPIVRTKEDVIRGKENVKGVVAELQEMFNTPSRAIGSRPKFTPDEPEFTEIPDVDGKSSLVYYCRNTTASKLAQTLDPLCGNNGYVEYNSEQNKILIIDAADRMDVFKKAIAALDTVAPQVLVEAKVVEVLLSNGMQRNLSVQFNRRDSSFDASGADSTVVSKAGSVSSSIGQQSSDSGGVFNWYPIAGDRYNMNIAFQWLLDAEDAKIISSPNITVSRGDTATINTGQDLPIQEQSQNGTTISFSTTYRNIGVTLRVTPKIINRRTALLNINPEVSNVLRYENITAAGVSYTVPIISVRSVDTNLTLYDGQVIMLGGLFNTREVLSEERTPFLSDLPYIEELFTAKSTTRELVQLLFVLRVTILNDEDLSSGVLFDPQQQASESIRLGEILKDPVTFPGIDTTLESVENEMDTAAGMKMFKKESPDEQPPKPLEP